MSYNLTEDQLRAIYTWIDAIPLSRPKRNIARDFSDGVLIAEVVAAYFPKLVELHNYPQANSLKQKKYNYETLNQRVLKNFGYTIPQDTIDDIINCRQGAVESVLNTIQIKMAKYREKLSREGVSPKNIPQPKKGQFENNNHNINNQNRFMENSPNEKKNKNDINHIVNEEILLEKEEQIRELQETVEVLELKIAKLEQLVRLKDKKIQKLMHNN